MQLFLSLADSDKDSPNENYARELMELFTLGTGYSEHDVREAARALTGFKSNWSHSGDFGGITYSPDDHDPGMKQIFDKRGRFDWHDVLDLVDHATRTTRPSWWGSCGPTSSPSRSIAARARGWSAPTATPG